MFLSSRGVRNLCIKGIVDSMSNFCQYRRLSKEEIKRKLAVLVYDTVNYDRNHFQVTSGKTGASN